ncbi:hypothetical protein HZ994_16010 [Akkermansiaceae bacterium]|nr:hypothetical protein HZ994_16010 [Akkermansiaceae bacterium]
MLDLTEGDRDEFEKIIREIQEIRDFPGFEDYALHRLPAFLGSHFANWNEHDEKMTLTRVGTSASHAEAVGLVLDSLYRTLPTHPTFQRYIDFSTGKARYVDTVERMREGLPDQEFRKLPFYRCVAKELGIVDQLVMHVFIKSGRGVVLTYHFPNLASRAQHLKASLLRGHLVARLYAIDMEMEKQAQLAEDIGGHLAKRITPREMTILRMICQGLGNHEIAAQLGISKRTTDHHVSNLLKKLSATNRFQLISRFGSWIEIA